MFSNIKRVLFKIINPYSDDLVSVLDKFIVVEPKTITKIDYFNEMIKMYSNIIKEDTEDLIAICDEDIFKNTLMNLLIIIIGLVALWIGVQIWSESHIGFSDMIVNFFLTSVSILFGGLALLAGSYGLLTKSSVIIEKNLRSVVVIVDSPIKRLKSTKKINFSQIEDIEISYTTECTGGQDYYSPANDPADTWVVSLITYNGDSILIYSGDYKSRLKAESISEKISKFTNKSISHKSYLD